MVIVRKKSKNFFGFLIVGKKYGFPIPYEEVADQERLIVATIETLHELTRRFEIHSLKILAKLAQ